MKKEAYSCDIVFKDLESNVRSLFSTIHILNCFDNKKEYLDVLKNPNIIVLFEDETLLETAEFLFKNNLNITQTSKSTYMHRNTLIYRLDKIKKLTGLNLKNFEDAIIFQNLICVKKLIS